MTSLKNRLQELGRQEILVLLIVLVIVGGTLGFILLADEVAEKDTQAFDSWAVKALRQSGDPSLPIGPRWLMQMGQDLTALGGVAVLSLVTAAVAGFLYLTRKRNAMYMVLAATIGGVLVGAALKAAYDRPRPQIVPHLTFVSSSSFPSGHSMLSAVVYLTLGALLARVMPTRRLKLYVLAVALTVTFLVGLSRVYLGVHYPTDVLAGWTAGLVWACLCWLGAWYLQRAGRVENSE